MKHSSDNFKLRPAYFYKHSATRLRHSFTKLKNSLTRLKHSVISLY